MAVMHYVSVEQRRLTGSPQSAGRITVPMCQFHLPLQRFEQIPVSDAHQTHVTWCERNLTVGVKPRLEWCPVLPVSAVSVDRERRPSGNCADVSETSVIL